MRDRRFVAAHRGGPLSLPRHRLLAAWAADCAERLLPLFEQHSPDGRPRQAVAVARAWARGEVKTGIAQRAAVAAHAAARAATEPAAVAVARAAGHAAATAHFADHCFGPVLYGEKAVRAAGGSAEQERAWQLARLPEAVRSLVVSGLAHRQTKAGVVDRRAIADAGAGPADGPGDDLLPMVGPEEVVTDPCFASFGRADSRWQCQGHAGVSISGRREGEVLCVVVVGARGVNWHGELRFAPFPVRRGRRATIRFRARAATPFRFGVWIGQSRSPWSSLVTESTHFGEKTMAREWLDFEHHALIAGDEDEARLNFVLGAVDNTIRLSDVSLTLDAWPSAVVASP